MVDKAQVLCGSTLSSVEKLGMVTMTMENMVSNPEIWSLVSDFELCCNLLACNIALPSLGFVEPGFGAIWREITVI